MDLSADGWPDDSRLQLNNRWCAVCTFTFYNRGLFSSNVPELVWKY